ncbi:MAG: ATP-dependent helicase [Planctomycetes bacterium]|nr:ATP-dependent helicase [Planctomycetota bacterium]
MSSSWLDQLNVAQRKAATHGDGPLLVVAGAGTGKTKTLASRVAWLIDQGVDPGRILLLAFTRRAAAEMIRRAAHLTGADNVAQVWGGTFHATANRLLRIYGTAVGIAPEFTVMDQSDAADMMNLLRNELGLSKRDRRFPKKGTLVSIYSRTVSAGEKLSDTLATYFPWCRDDGDAIREIFELYIQRKRKQNVLDYDDLLLFWRALCTSAVADRVADRFDHILVDEYQDTNSIQAEILLRMRRNCTNIMVVGDDAQSIYSFRAATIKNILDFPETFAGTRVVTLEQNYRSIQPILDASNRVMSYATQRYTKELWSERKSEQKPILIHCIDEPQQCTAVCENILGHLEEGIPLMRQAVLFRAGHHSDQLEVELSRRNIPFHKYGGLKFIEAGHIKDLLALLRILENPHDEMSWFRVLLLLDGVGPKIARRLMDALGVGRRTDADAASPKGDTAESPLRRLASNPPTAPPAAREQFEQLCTVLKQLGGVQADAGQPDGVPLPTQMERLYEFYEPIFQRTYDNYTIRLRDIEQLQNIAASYKSRCKFITDLTLDPPSSTSDLTGPPHLDEDYLILSTIHSAKGCEWDVVHIIHAADGMIPSDMSTGNDAGIDEERRLFYVAMTRAKDMLYVYFPLRYYHRRHALGDGHSFAQLTRFITRPVRALFEERIPQQAETPDDQPIASPAAAQQPDYWLKQLWQQ